MRRPTAPAQRPLPVRPERPPVEERPAPASVLAHEPAARSVDPAAPPVESDAQLTEPIALFGAEEQAAQTARSASDAPSSTGSADPSGSAGAPGASPRADASASAPERGLVSRFESWRAVRRAAGRRRRVERQEARRFTARTRRLRKLQLVGAAVVVAVIGGAVVTAYSPLMSLKHIEVVGTHSVTAAAVQKALAGELGTPLPLVRSGDIRHALDDFRLIESYSTQLRPPSTLVVEITERTPLAVVKEGSSYELVDQAGVVLAAGAKRQAGYPLVALKAGEQPSSSEGFAAAAAVVAALPASVRKTVTGASATSANDVTLNLAGGKTVVWGGPDQIELKTADLQALLKGAAGAHVYDVSSPRAPITR
ncbi:MAG TPA: FtsQ-type POTRA domain-containing protein [Gryllotalpicola sp.]